MIVFYDEELNVDIVLCFLYIMKKLIGQYLTVCVKLEITMPFGKGPLLRC